MTQERTFRKIRIDKYTRDLLKKAGIEKVSGLPIRVSQEQIDKLVVLLGETSKEQFPTLHAITAQDGDAIYVVTIGNNNVAATQFTKIMRLNPDSGWQNMKMSTLFERVSPCAGYFFACA